MRHSTRLEVVALCLILLIAIFALATAVKARRGVDVLPVAGAEIYSLDLAASIASAAASGPGAGTAAQVGSGRDSFIFPGSASGLVEIWLFEGAVPTRQQATSKFSASTVLYGLLPEICLAVSKGDFPEGRAAIFEFGGLRYAVAWAAAPGGGAVSVVRAEVSRTGLSMDMANEVSGLVTLLAVISIVSLLFLGVRGFMISGRYQSEAAAIIEFIDSIKNGFQPFDIEDRCQFLSRVAKPLTSLSTGILELISRIFKESEKFGKASESLSIAVYELSDGAERLRERSSGMAASMDTACDGMSSVSSAAEEMSTSISSVASSVEEMSLSIRGVSGNCVKERAIADQAMGTIMKAKATMERLRRAADEIGSVLQVIEELAGQTNLLAINATIEAARAGELGKGFAVVASEVKDLAKQTSTSTGEISRQIAGIQTSSAEAIEAIAAIFDIVQEFCSISNFISSAMEEQSRAADDIAGNTAHVDAAAREISKGVTEAAEGLKTGAEEIGRIHGHIEEIAKAVSHAKDDSLDMALAAASLKTVTL